LGLLFSELPGGRGPEACAVPGAQAELLVEVAGDGLPEWSARVVSTYGDLRPGELGLIRDSWGQAALALNGASASEFLGVGRGMMVMLTPATQAATGAAAEPQGGAPDQTAPGKDGDITGERSHR
jgi:hypothetical protein